LSLGKHALPFFGEAKLITEIIFDEVKSLILKMKGQGYHSNTIWHVVTDLRATLNWAMGQGLLVKNPVNKTTSPQLRKIVGKIKSAKASMDLSKVDKAVTAIKHAVDRAWFDVCRFMGLRKDECNRMQWSDINFEIGEIHIRGSKTEGSDEWLPVAPVVLETLKRLKESREDQNCSWVFPGRSHNSRGKKVYDRRHVFEQIEADTGIHLKAKDLRDYFATEIANKVNDPATVMKLLRHSNLRTTAIYLRTVK